MDGFLERAYTKVMDINLYAAATPAVLAIIAAEFAYCLYQKNDYYRFDDAIANFGTAIGHQITNVAVAAMVFATYAGIYARFGFADWGRTPGSFAAMYFGLDFLFYCFHRAGHSINLFWAAHSPHHSSDELNYTVGLRASVTQRFVSFLFYAPLAFVAAPEILLPVVSLHLLFQLIPHTRVIKHLPKWIESWLNTPTHHRVHHAINPQYLDKNYGGTLIIWDKMFGSYAEEVEEPVYGVMRPLATFDPIAINGQYFGMLWEDMKATKSWTDKIKLWFMPTGWRPADLAPRPAAPSTYGRKKLRANLTSAQRAVFLAELPLLLGLMMLVTREDSPLGLAGKLAAGVGVWAWAIWWGRRLDSAIASNPTAAASSVRTIPPRVRAAAV